MVIKILHSDLRLDILNELDFTVIAKIALKHTGVSVTGFLSPI